MQDFFEPSYAVLGFLVLKKFLYLPLLLLLALARVIAGRSLARTLAGLTIVLAVCGIAALFAPAILDLRAGPVMRISFAIINAGAGMAMLLAASAPLAASAIVPQTRWRWIDWGHGALLITLVVLWWATR